MLSFEFRIRDLLIATAASALMLVIGLYGHWRYYTPMGVYQSRKDGSALLGILGEEIRNGDSRESVTVRLGPGSVIEDEKSRARILENIKRQPIALPDGARETDVFVEYAAMEGFAVTLQFRDGILVNFNLPQPMRQAMRQHDMKQGNAQE